MPTFRILVLRDISLVGRFVKKNKKPALQLNINAVETTCIAAATFLIYGD
jgi:hypothetical protein